MGSSAAAFPPTAKSLCCWVDDLGGSGRTKTSTIKLYLTGLRSYCIDLGQADLTAFDDPRLQRILRGIKIFHAAPETEPQERLPITRDILLRIITGLDQNTHEGTTLCAAFCLAFAAFLRIGEFTWSNSEWRSDGDFKQWHITRSSVRFHPPGLTPDRAYLTLPASKTDPFRRGITLTIAASGTNDRACAVFALHRLLEGWPAAPHTPLFSNTHLTHNPNTATASSSETLANFDRVWVVNKLRELLTRAGITGHYSGHSFRRGAATWARQAGILDGDIQLLGRWKSDAYKRYIEVHPEHIHNVSLRLQTFSPQDNTTNPRPVHPQPPTGPLPTTRGRRFGGLGRAGRGAGEPGPASGAASLAGSPPRGPQ